MRLRLPRRRLWRAAIYLGSLVLVLVAADLVLVQVWRSYERGYDTTRIVAPVLPDGRVDYLLAIDGHFGRGVTAEKNAAPLLLLAFGRQGLADNQPTNGVTERLGMPPLPEKGDYLVKYGDFLKGREGGDEPDVGALVEAGRWPVEIGPVAREWVKANERALKVVAEASRRPRFFIPFYAGTRPETMVEIRLPHAFLMRETARALLLRAMLRVEGGDVAGASEDLLTCHRLARLLGQAPSLVERITATRIEIMACQAGRVVAASGKMGAAEARRLAGEVARLGDVPSGEESVDWSERLCILDMLQWMARGGPEKVAVFFDVIAGQETPRPSAMMRVATRFYPVPYERCMRVMNHFYDGAVVAWRRETWADRRETMRLWTAEVERRTDRNKVLIFLSADWPARLLLPALTRVMTVAEQARAQRRLTVLALGLAAYRAEHGGYPASLEELVPGYLPAVPADPFTDAGFGYARAGSGYRLHSVGPDMVDHGGAEDDLPVMMEAAAKTSTRPGR